MSILIDGEWVRIKGDRYYDSAQQPKSGYAVAESLQSKLDKVEQEKHRQDFLQKWEKCYDQEIPSNFDS